MMFKAWSNLTMLAFESQQVVFLRLAKIAAGGPAAIKEIFRMTTEKVEAAAQATDRAARGASHDSIVKGYRKRVRANLNRLSK
jgi:hypothetical protein